MLGWGARAMPESITFAALDGRVLHGTIYGDPETAHTALLLNAGTGIPRRFYRHFCAYAAQQGFVAMSYDYRGIGDSAPASLKGSVAVYRDWGQRDVPGAIDRLRAAAPGRPLVVVGHSTGGQQLGLSDRVRDVRAALFVTVSTGYWRGMPLGLGLLNLALWRLFAPLCQVALGYFPSRIFGLGENLPIGVAREWGDWCLEPDYLAAYLDGTGRRRCRDGRAFGEHYFGEARFPIRSINFEDDPIASRPNVPPLLGLYANAPQEVEWHNATDYGAQEVGHLGFFRKAHAARWTPYLDWLRTTAQG